VIVHEAFPKGRCGCSAPLLTTNAKALEEVVIGFVRIRAGGAYVVTVAALTVVEYCTRGKEKHAEFEDEFVLLETRLVCRGEAVPAY
jgi:hypothetical protein